MDRRQFFCAAIAFVAALFGIKWSPMSNPCKTIKPSGTVSIIRPRTMGIVPAHYDRVRYMSDQVARDIIRQEDAKVLSYLRRRAA